MSVGLTTTPHKNLHATETTVAISSAVSLKPYCPDSNITVQKKEKKEQEKSTFKGELHSCFSIDRLTTFYKDSNVSLLEKSGKI